MGCKNHGEARYGCDECISAVRIRFRMFPLQSSRGGYGPPSIPWEIADKAFMRYSARYGKDQSLERIAERGGFGWCEMDLFYPAWREEIDQSRTIIDGLRSITETSSIVDAKSIAFKLIDIIDGKKP